MENYDGWVAEVGDSVTIAQVILLECPKVLLPTRITIGRDDGKSYEKIRKQRTNRRQSRLLH